MAIIGNIPYFQTNPNGICICIVQFEVSTECPNIEIAKFLVKKKPASCWSNTTVFSDTVRSSCLLRTRTVQPFGDDYPYNLQFTSFQCLRSEVLIKFIQITIIYPHYITIIPPALVKSPLVKSLSTIDPFGWMNLDEPRRSKTRHLNRRVPRIFAEDLLEHHQEKLTAPGRIIQRVKARKNMGISSKKC